MQYTRFPFFSRLVCTDVYRSARYCDNDAVCRYQTRHPPQCTECACMYMLPVYCTHMNACTACGYCIQIAYVPKRGRSSRPAAFITVSHACTLPCFQSPPLSSTLPICNLFRVKSLVVLAVYPLASVSHLHIFHSLSRCAISHVLIRCPSFSRCAPDRGRRSRGVLHCMHASSHASHLHLFRSLSRSVVSSI